MVLQSHRGKQGCGTGQENSGEVQPKGGLIALAAYLLSQVWALLLSVISGRLHLGECNELLFSCKLRSHALPQVPTAGTWCTGN